MTQDQIIEATKRRARGENFATIARALKLTSYQVRKHIVPGFMETKKLKERARTLELRQFMPKLQRHSAAIPQDVPRDVLFDREYRRQLAPRSFTAAFCGDPLPGYAALDKRGA